MVTEVQERIVMFKFPVNDDHFRDGKVVSVGNGSFNGDDGWSLGIPDDFKPRPKVGDSYRTYGKGIGSPVRGLFFNGRRVWYRTESEQKEKHRRECEESDQKQRDEFDSNRAEMDARYRELPFIFKLRLDKFRHNNPDFRWKYESYELFVCEEAVRIAEELGTPEAVTEFAALPHEEQRERVILSDGHSGNTFGAACTLARLYLTDENAVEQMHGALAPLVGSEEYGCVARTASQGGKD